MAGNRIGFQIKSKGSLAALVQALPTALSTALNDSLYRTRDKLVRETYLKEEEIRGAGGRRLRAAQRRTVGRSVFQVRNSDERSLTGNISINVQTPETRAQRFANLSLRDIIHGFVHSTYPRFVGKSRKDRIRMALAVYYRAKRGLSFQESTASRMVKTTARRDIIQHFNEYMIAASERNFPYRTKRAVAAANKAPEKTK